MLKSKAPAAAASRGEKKLTFFFSYLFPPVHLQPSKNTNRAPPRLPPPPPLTKPAMKASPGRGENSSSGREMAEQQGLLTALPRKKKRPSVFVFVSLFFLFLQRLPSSTRAGSAAAASRIPMDKFARGELVVGKVTSVSPAGARVALLGQRPRVVAFCPAKEMGAPRCVVVSAASQAGGGGRAGAQGSEEERSGTRGRRR